MRRRLIYTSHFLKQSKRWLRVNRNLQDQLWETLTRLENDAFDSKLKTHKLKGRMAGSWAASAGYDLRVVFEFTQETDGECILLQSLGSHDHVYE